MGEYESEATRHKHITFKHRGLKYIRCIEDCDELFSSKKDRKNHISDVHRRPIYHCPAKNCDKQFRSRNAKLDHISAKHPGLKYIRCIKADSFDCGKLFSLRKEILNHVTSAHEIYHCPVENCDKYFGSSSGKDYHLHTKHPELTRF